MVFKKNTHLILAVVLACTWLQLIAATRAKVPNEVEPKPKVECTREATLSKDVYDVSWTADLDTKNIQFRVVARTTGYVGFGLSQYTGMVNSDIVMGGVLPDGTTYFAVRALYSINQWHNKVYVIRREADF